MTKQKFLGTTVVIFMAFLILQENWIKMKVNNLILICILMILTRWSYAQKTPKSKAADKLYEKNIVTIPLSINLSNINTGDPVKAASIYVFSINEKGIIEDDSFYQLDLKKSEEKEGLYNIKLIRNEYPRLEEEPIVTTNKQGMAELLLPMDKELLLLITADNFRREELKISTKTTLESNFLEIDLEPADCITLYGQAVDSKTGRGIPNAEVSIRYECANVEANIRTNLKGDFTACLPPECYYAVLAYHDAYQVGAANLSTVAKTPEKKIYTQVVLVPQNKSLSRNILETDNMIRLEQIKINSTKSMTFDFEDRTFAAIVRLMEEYRGLNIEVGSHTDSNGAAKANLKLSEKRAKIIRNYLIEQGIDAERITAIGYGESQLLNECRDDIPCSEWRNKENRRIEIKILGE